MQLALVALFVAAPQIVFETRSSFEHILVVDEGHLRYLRFGTVDGDDQSMIDLRDRNALPMEYIRLALHGLVDVAERRRALVVGLGAGTFVNGLRARAPEMEIDAVEIDPMVVEVAGRYFGFAPDARTHVHVEDAVTFVPRDGPHYDIILLDAYGAGGVPEPLATDAFFAAVAKRLAPGGVVVANLSVAPDEEKRLLAGLARAWPHRACQRTSDASNVLVFAASRPLLQGEPRVRAARRAAVLDAGAAARLRACAR